jgi:hypothetical protein
MIAAVSSLFCEESGRMFMITGGRIARIVQWLSPGLAISRAAMLLCKSLKPGVKWRTCERRLLLVAALATLLLGRLAAAQDRFPGGEWDHVAPAQSGWSDLRDSNHWGRSGTTRCGA